MSLGPCLDARRRLQMNDLTTYNLELAAAARSSQWTTVLALLAEAESTRVQGDLVSFNTAISCLSRTRRWELALHLFAGLQKWRM
ncbi:unnamed protein product, partial [Symbiodinium sp. CCMP2456]